MGIIKFLFNSKKKSQHLSIDIISHSELPSNKKEIKPYQLDSISKEETEKLIQQFAKDEFKIKESLINRDELFEDAAKLVVSAQIGSTALIQRRMRLNFNRAGRLLDQLEFAGIVGPNQGSKGREVKIKSDEDLVKFLSYSISRVDLMEFYEKNKTEIEKASIEYKKELEIEKLDQEKEKIRQTLLEKDRKKQLSRKVLKELIEEGAISNQFIDKQGKREPIPQEIMDKVWTRDGGKCVKCGSQQNLEFDHIIPFSKGGATTYRNLQILCKSCNVEKSNSIG